MSVPVDFNPVKTLFVHFNADIRQRNIIFDLKENQLWSFEK